MYKRYIKPGNQRQRYDWVHDTEHRQQKKQKKTKQK